MWTNPFLSFNDDHAEPRALVGLSERDQFREIGMLVETASVSFLVFGSFMFDSKWEVEQ